MYRREPIYITPCDVILAEDKIRPYGGWTSESSEKVVEEIVLKLWRGPNYQNDNSKDE